jgi:tetratricopeptide (TPR) repeat protein
VGWTLNELGNLHQKQGRLTEARQCYERSLTILEGYRSEYKKGQVLINLARLHHQLGQSDQAWEYLHRAEENAQRYGFSDQRSELMALEVEFRFTPDNVR